MSVVEPLNKKFGPISEFRLLQHGYTANTYLFQSHGERFFAKQIDIKPGTNLNEVLEPDDIFQRETAKITLLTRYNTEFILVPEILYEDRSNYLYVQRYYDFRRFNYLLGQLVNRPELINLLRELSRFLAIFHAENVVRMEDNVPWCHLHGDLNNKNIGITSAGQLIVIDPGFRSDELVNSVYFDISRVLLNFFPYNIWHASRIGKEKQFLFAREFLDTYLRYSRFSISPIDIVDYALERNLLFRTNYASRKNYVKNIAMFILGAHIHRELLEFRRYVASQ